MKWIILVVLLLLIGAVLFLRTVRAQADGRSTSRPHRLDESLSPSDASPPDDQP